MNGPGRWADEPDDEPLPIDEERLAQLEAEEADREYDRRWEDERERREEEPWR